MGIINDNLIRSVSVYEYNLGIFGNVLSRNKLKGKIDSKAFTKALQIITYRHPFLNAVFFKYEDKLYFKKQHNHSLPLTIRYNIIDAHEKDNLYREELNNILNPFENLWRILLIYECNKDDELHGEQNIEMILTLFHSICDGNCLLNLVKEILEQIQAIQGGKTLYENQNLPVNPPIDEILNNHSHELINNISEQESKQNPKNNILKLDINFNIKETQCKINFVGNSFSRGETDILIKKYKENNTTMHGLICAAMSIAISKNINHNPDEKSIFFLCSAIDYRKQYTILPGKNHLSSCAFVEVISFPIDMNCELITLAKEIKKLLAENIRKSVGIKKILSQYAANELISYIDHKNVKTILSVSNVGKVDIPADYSDFSLLATNFTASKIFPNILLSVLTFNETLIYTILFTEPWLNSEFIKDIEKDFRALLFS